MTPPHDRTPHDPITAPSQGRSVPSAPERSIDAERVRREILEQDAGSQPYVLMWAKPLSTKSPPTVMLRVGAKLPPTSDCVGGFRFRFLVTAAERRAATGTVKPLHP